MSKTTKIHLIQLTDFKTVKEYLDFMKQVKPETVLATFEGQSFREVFWNRLKYYLLQVAENQMLNEKVTTLNVWLDKFITSSVHRNFDLIKKCFPLQELYAKEDKYFFNTSVLKSEEKILVLRNTYFKLLEKEEDRFIAIGVLENPYILRSYPFREVLNAHKKAELLPVVRLNDSMQMLWTELDASYEEHLKSMHAIEKPRYVSKEELPKFDWEYFKNPIPLQEYPKHLLAYKKSLIGWLKDQLYQRKKRLLWEETPKTYQIIEAWIAEIESEISGINPAKKPITKQKATQSEESIASKPYPAHIFANQKDYEFFCLLAKASASPKQMGFLYRIMSEQEQPPKILVKDTPFRAWLNEQNDLEIKLEYHTPTWANVKNKDRLWAYRLAKSLFYDQEVDNPHQNN